MRKFSRHHPPSPYLNTSKAVQAGFGLTQQQLAYLLGVSRSTLTMDGQDGTGPGSIRYLPTAAELRLVALQQQLPAPYGPAPTPAAATEAPAPLLPDERETLELRQQKIALEKYPLEKQLARCQTRLAQARLRQQALPQLQATLAPDDAFVAQVIDHLTQQAAQTLAYDSSTAQLLELRLRLLDYETAEIERLLEN
ncbi:hypothetical protein J7E24_04615 [Hymenobacter sp. ISL-91]|uniref:hypothetical protein n=1 Tax=Hymenobacter sp. ISL-91 TaxID=2819151 RepID=UPI001BE4FF5D|nr:hypothetical protein [Hymenobacter sp. ISL-91]MBT2557056.1 hypothetical protein [Hymenobacter sp. ISL-91]